MKFISCGFLESDYNITPFIFSVEGSWFAGSSDQKDRSRTRKKEKPLLCQNRLDEWSEKWIYLRSIFLSR